jgi:hypothetical protein
MFNLKELIFLVNLFRLTAFSDLFLKLVDLKLLTKLFAERQNGYGTDLKTLSSV